MCVMFPVLRHHDVAVQINLRTMTRWSKIADKRTLLKNDIRGMDTSNIDTVFVSGKAMKPNGELLHMNWNAVKKTVTESRDYVIKKSGFKLPPI